MYFKKRAPIEQRGSVLRIQDPKASDFGKFHFIHKVVNFLYDTSRPLIVPLEYPLHFDDFLLPCSISTQSVKPLTVLKHLVSSPLDDKDKSYYTALSKQSYSYNELLFISAKVTSYMVQAELKTERKPPSTELTSHIGKAPEKLSYVLNNRTLREIDHLMKQYKQNSSDSAVTTLTHLVYSFERRHKLLQSLDLDSQRITQKRITHQKQ